MHRIPVGTIARQLVESSPHNGRLSCSGQARPVNCSPKVRADSSRDEAVLIHETNKAIGGSNRSLKEVVTIRNKADTDKALHRVSNGVKKRLVGVAQTTIAIPAIGFLPR